MRAPNGKPGWERALRAKWLHVVFVLCAALVFASAPLRAATLTLSAPVYGTCGVVTMNGAPALSAGDTVAQITWNWGDGSTSALILPATHKYSQDGTFTVRATTRTVGGDSATASTRVVINSSGDPACALSGPYYTATTVAGVDFAAGQTAKATALNLNDPTHIAVDGQDNLYIGDIDSFRVWRITPAGAASLVAGTGTGYADPPLGGVYSATGFPLAYPTAVTVDKAGVPYILNYAPFRVVSDGIYKVTSDGISRVANGNTLDVYAPFFETLAIDPMNNLYVGDWYYGGTGYTGGIAKLSPAGVATAFKGNGIQLAYPQETGFSIFR